MNENCEWCVRLKNDLEGLKAELEEARTELEGCMTLGKGLYDAYATIDKLKAENARLRAEGEEMDAHWHAEVAKLQAENARLREEVGRLSADRTIRAISARRGRIAKRTRCRAVQHRRPQGLIRRFSL